MRDEVPPPHTGIPVAKAPKAPPAPPELERGRQMSTKDAIECSFMDAIAVGRARRRRNSGF